MLDLITLLELGNLIGLIVFATSIWVLIDAQTIGVKKGQLSGFFNMGAVGWFLSCLLLWVVAFPAYVAKRSQYKVIGVCT